MNQDYKERMHSEWHVSHEGVKHHPQVVRSLKDPQSFFESVLVDADLS